MAKRLQFKDRRGPMTGALARLHLKADRLYPAVGELADEVGFDSARQNPFHNNLAQALEVAQVVEDCIDALGRLELKHEDRQVPDGCGTGAAMTEAPRGLLYHAYTVDRKGLIEHGRIMTPTVHNFQSIEDDLQTLAASMADQSVDEIKLHCEMLVRAYDPCFSCSVH